MGQYQEALSRFNEALQSDPDEPIIHLHVAQVLEKLGRTKEAEEQRQKAQRLSSGCRLPQEMIW
jgi:Flp pilus assembly protein TadD